VDRLLLHQLMDRRSMNYSNDMGLTMLARLCAVDSFHFLHQQDVAHLDVLQNLDEQIRDVRRPYLDVALHLVGVVADVELHRQLKMDYFLDVVGVEQRYLKRKDYFPDVALQALPVLTALLHRAV
jgi:hypothetical protein